MLKGFLIGAAKGALDFVLLWAVPSFLLEYAGVPYSLDPMLRVLAAAIASLDFLEHSLGENSLLACAASMLRNAGVVSYAYLIMSGGVIRLAYMDFTVVMDVRALLFMAILPNIVGILSDIRRFVDALRTSRR